MKKVICSIVCLCGLTSPIHSQSVAYNQMYRTIIENGDTVWMVLMRPVYCFPPLKFKNSKEEKYYWRTVRDVKKTLPYAKLVYNALIETYEYIQTLPEKERKAHLKRMEKELFKEYKPVLKTSFNLIKAFLGGFRANVWQTFGSLFGVSLKKEWEPEGSDKMLERICILVESGQL